MRRLGSARACLVIGSAGWVLRLRDSSEMKSRAPTRRTNVRTMGAVPHMHLIASTGCGKGE